LETQIARYIDHAVLKPEMSRQEAEEAIRLGIDLNVRTVCVRPCDIPLALSMCQNTQTDVSCVLAFPHGCVPYEVKAFEAAQYCKMGVNEIDMVVNYGNVRSGLWEEVKKDIGSVAEVTQKNGVLLKVIFETCTLTRDEIYRTTDIAVDAGADFIKTSTGFHSQGATLESVKYMLEAAKGRIKVKASGGIRDLETARRYVEMGCQRLGVGYSTTPVLVSGEGQSQSQY
jgi:deoxyribose-phosphate aldolase